MRLHCPLSNSDLARARGPLLVRRDRHLTNAIGSLRTSVVRAASALPSYTKADLCPNAIGEDECHRPRPLYWVQGPPLAQARDRPPAKGFAAPRNEALQSAASKIMITII